jgi:hypothetical protein
VIARIAVTIGPRPELLHDPGEFGPPANRPTRTQASGTSLTVVAGTPSPIEYATGRASSTPLSPSHRPGRHSVRNPVCSSTWPTPRPPTRPRALDVRACRSTRNRAATGTRHGMRPADLPMSGGVGEGPITSRNSTYVRGQPRVITSGSASGSGERACTKWMFTSSMRRELWPGVHSASSGNEVVPVEPVGSQVLHELEGDAQRAVVHGLALGPRVFRNRRRRSSTSIGSNSTSQMAVSSHPVLT